MAKHLIYFLMMDLNMISRLPVYIMEVFLYFCRGKLPEWSNGADSKSVEPLGVPGVRIPRFPQEELDKTSQNPDKPYKSAICRVFYFYFVWV